MPPKKSKKKSAKRQKSASSNAETPAGPSANETTLRAELESLDKDLAEYKKKVEELRLENEWLKDEIDRTANDSNEYITQLTNKTKDKEKIIASLEETNKKQLAAVRAEKQRTLDHYEARKKRIASPNNGNRV
eukprot:Colp12_sorted_trinity150504_noHs@27362